MSVPPRRAVVGASVAVKLFVSDPLGRSPCGFSGLGSDDRAELIVRLVFSRMRQRVLEMGAAMRYPSKHAASHQRDLGRLGLTVVPTRALADAALGIALGYRITAYDACHVAAAARLGLPLVTADRKRVNALAASPLDIRWLGDVAAMG